MDNQDNIIKYSISNPTEYINAYKNCPICSVNLNDDFLIEVCVYHSKEGKKDYPRDIFIHLRNKLTSIFADFLTNNITLNKNDSLLITDEKLSEGFHLYKFKRKSIEFIDEKYFEISFYITEF